MDIFSFLIQQPYYVLDKLWQHFYIFLFSWSIAVGIGLLIGIFATRSGKEKMGRWVLSVTGAAQAVPSVAVIALVFLFTGIGPVPAIIALFIYSLVPIVFNTASGLINVSDDVKESARGMGMTNLQILLRIELPLSLPTIWAGIRSSATINIGTATIAAVIGAGGLGEIIFIGLDTMNSGMIFSGAIVVAALAIAVDTVLGITERFIVSKGIRMNDVGN